MTDNLESKRSRDRLYTYLTLLLTLLLIALGGIFKRGVAYGLKISFENLIPTIFPFMIISDLCSSYLRFNPGSIPSRIFEKTFCIPPSAIVAFLLGTLCGFPLGVKAAKELYNKGEIDHDQLIRLCGFSNNPSLAFVVFGIGSGLYGKAAIGIILYFSVVFSAIITGYVFRDRGYKSNNCDINFGQSFVFVDSVKNAALGSLYICAFVSFFCGLIEAAELFIKNRFGLSITASILEVSTACSVIYENRHIFPVSELPVIGFALGFSGFSVHLQSRSFLPKEAAFSRYIMMKLFQGIVCFVTVLIVAYITKI